MIDSALLAILACPETHQPLREATAAEVADVNQRIARGTAKTRIGSTVAEPIEGGLVRQDGYVLYPIRHGIPIMLSEEAIPL
jgi:uncharacterized protein